MSKNLKDFTKESIYNKMLAIMLIITLTVANIVILAELTRGVMAETTVTIVTDIDLYLNEYAKTPSQVEISSNEPNISVQENNLNITEASLGEDNTVQEQKIALELEGGKEDDIVTEGEEISYTIYVKNKNIDEDGNLLNEIKIEDSEEYKQNINKMEQLLNRLEELNEILDIEEEPTELEEYEAALEEYEDIMMQLDELEKYFLELPEQINMSEYATKNIVVKDILPVGLTYKTATRKTYNIDTGEEELTTAGVTYNQETREVTWNAGEMLYEPYFELSLTATVDKLPNEIYKKDIVNNVVATYENSETIKSNEIKYTIARPEVKTDKTFSNADGKFNFKFSVTNVGLLDYNDFNMSIEIPEELQSEEITYGFLANEQTGRQESITTRSFSDRQYPLLINTLEVGDTYVVELVAIVNPGYTGENKNVDVKVLINGGEATWNLEVEKQTENLPDSNNSNINNSINNEVNINFNTNNENSINLLNLKNDANNLYGIGSKVNFSIDKYVSKIIVQNVEGTSTYNFGNSKLAKVDINTKYVNETVILIEYKMLIKNIGEVAGTVKTILDQMPKDLTFQSELNSNWVLAQNGNLYNSELKDININPNETKEVILTLKKKLTEDNIGVIKNIAGIAELGNNQDIKDMDAGDNTSSAEAIISLKTGR